ncbi:MAG: GPW/gp25 family protein [Verrucomicrobiota bacterium]
MSASSADYLGTGWRFPPSFDRDTGSAAIVSGDEDVAQSIYLILSTALGERPLAQKFGCDIQQFAFEEIDQALLTGLTNVIQASLQEYEPRVGELAISVLPDENQQGVLNIAVQYTIRATNSRYNLVYPYYLTEGAGTPELVASNLTPMLG